MNYDSYMNPMFSDMDNKYIYPMPYVNPMVYMNPYMMNQMPNQPQQQCGVENQQESYQNPYQGNPMMYMNPYLMNPMMGNMDPNMMMQMMMQTVMHRTAKQKHLVKTLQTKAMCQKAVM